MPSTTQRSAAELQVRSVNRETRTIDFIASTYALDSHGTRIDQSGWEFAPKIPITWAHDDRGYTPSGGRPIGRAVNLRVENGKLVGTAEFPKRGVFPFADETFELAADGFITATSVGFDPILDETIEEEGKKVLVFRKQKLVEIALVTIPSNEEALIQSRAKVLNREGEAKDIQARLKRVEELAEEDRIIPKNVSTERAEEGDGWSAPTLSDFTDKEWGDLTDDEKRNIAGHFAWAKEMPPESFGSLKLPHHRASDGKVVWKGCVAAVARLNQADIPSSDVDAVESHFKAHYEAFGKEWPEEKAYSKEDIEKWRGYFEKKQPVNKVSTKVLEKFFKKMLKQDPPENEKEAWETVERAVEAIEEEPEKPEVKPEEVVENGATTIEVKEEPTTPPTPAVEAPQPAQEAPVQLSIKDLVTLIPKIREAATEALVKASREGVPRSEWPAISEAAATGVLKALFPTHK